MNRLTWESFSFIPGIHSYHEYQAGGDVFARDMANLRADQNGYLRQRNPTREVGSSASGVANDPRFLWFVRNGNLYYEYLDGSVRGRRVVHGIYGSLAGRLWVVSEFRDFVIIKTESDDRGYWVDVRDDMFRAYPLGYKVPQLPDISFVNVSGDGRSFSVGGIYIFALTVARGFSTHTGRLLDKEFNVSEELFNGTESNPVYFVVKIDNTSDIDFYLNGEELDSSHIFSGSVDQGLKIANVDIPGGANLWYLYTTSSINTADASGVSVPGGRLNIETLVYRVNAVTDEESPTSTFNGAYSDDGRSLRIDNHVLPDKPAQITYYNDLVFAAVGEELRYSDVRDGSPVQWAWPEANSINVEGEVLFCIEHRGVLLFGGPHGVWRLAGTDEFNFSNDQISAIGPVSRNAFSTFEQGVGFISTGGFYVTDGVVVTKISSPHLDSFFEENTIADGSITLLPDNNELWAVELADGTQRQFIKSIRGGWFGWEDVDAAQSARFVRTGTEGVRTELVYYADGTLREIIWDDYMVDAELSWSWKSNVIDFKNAGAAEALKLFRWIEVSSEHDGDGLLRVWVDGGAVVEIEFEFLGDTQRPVRVPINRRGEKIQFEVSGVGEVVVRYLRLVADTRSRRTRY